MAALVLVLAWPGAAARGRAAAPATVQPPPVCQADVAPPFKPETLPGRASLQARWPQPCPAGCRRVRPGRLALAGLLDERGVALPGQGSWSGQGSAEPLYAWASAGKQAIAAVVLQLADEAG